MKPSNLIFLRCTLVDPAKILYKTKLGQITGRSRYPIRISPLYSAAFTLIELLTVIAIIGILAAIIIPVVGSVKKKAYQARSMSNLRQLQTANILYANEDKNNYYVPLNIYSEPIWMRNTDFRKLFGYEPYDSTKGNEYMPIFRSGFHPDRNRQPSIGMNQTVEYSSEHNYSSNVKTTDIEVPSKTFCFAEGIDWQLSYNKRHMWTESNDMWTSDMQSVAYRGGQCLAVAYAGNVFKFTREEANNKQLWYARESDWGKW